MKFADELEQASAHEANAIKIMLNLHANRNQPPPEFNSLGEKVCIECGEVIPAQRAAIKSVSRCIICQKETEK